MCVKLPHRDINSSHCPPYLISTYTCEVTIIPRYAMMSMNLTIGRFVHASQFAYHVITTQSINILGFKKYLKECMFVLFFKKKNSNDYVFGYFTILCSRLTLNLQLHGAMAGSKQNKIK